MHGSDLEESSDHVSEYAALSEVHSSVYWKTILNMSFPSFCNGTPPGVSLPHGLPWQPQTLGPHLDPGHVLCSQKPPCFCGAGLMGRFAVNAPTSLCPVSLGGFPSRGGPCVGLRARSVELESQRLAVLRPLSVVLTGARMARSAGDAARRADRVRLLPAACRPGQPRCGSTS